MSNLRALALLLVVAGVATGAGAYAYYSQGGQVTTMSGSLFVSDAGQSHGGFEYTASYNVTLSVRGGQGTMTVTQWVGLGDVLTTHEFTVTNFQKTGTSTSMDVSGQRVVLPLYASDDVWDHTYDNYYIASWGSSAPPNEIRGTISPAVFPGVPDGYYVEMRLA